MKRNKQQQTPSQTDPVLVMTMEKIYHTIRSLLWNVAKDVNLSPIQMQCLIFLSREKAFTLNVSELAREFNMTRATISDALRVLSVKGYILKSSSNLDRREVQLSLSPEGKRMVENIRSWNDPLLRELKHFAADEKGQVMDFFLRFLETLRKKNILDEIRTCFSCVSFRPGKMGKSGYCIFRKLSLNAMDLQLNCANYRSSSRT